jgi:hypothetical protein
MRDMIMISSNLEEPEPRDDVTIICDLIEIEHSLGEKIKPNEAPEYLKPYQYIRLTQLMP